MTSSPGIKTILITKQFLKRLPKPVAVPRRGAPNRFHWPLANQLEAQTWRIAGDRKPANPLRLPREAGWSRALPRPPAPRWRSGRDSPCTSRSNSSSSDRSRIPEPFPIQRSRRRDLGQECGPNEERKEVSRSGEGKAGGAKVFMGSNSARRSV